MQDTVALLKRLADGGVEFVVIGGVAAIAYGGSVSTDDLDVCAPLHTENATKIIRALEGLHPRWRTRPDLPVITPDSPQLRPGLQNLYLGTDLGKLDVLGEVPEVCSYAEVASRSIEADFEGVMCRIIDLDTLISAKRVAGREKDVATLRHLEVLKKAREKHPGAFDP
jgi:predicted nucleotidyltransferase